MSINTGSPLLDYQIVVQNRDRMMAQFQKTPTYARQVAYYQSNIGKVKSVDDLLNNRNLLTVALSAFQLEDQIDAKGILRQLLKQDPNDPKSLAQRLIDPRYKQFALAFASLKSDGGKQIGTPSSVTTVLNQFQENEFEKAMGEDDPAVRQALYVQRTIGDTIDLKNVTSLMTTFKASPQVTSAVKYYQTNVQGVTGPADLLGDDNLLSVALTAYGLGDLIVDKPTVSRLLTEDPNAAGSLAQTDSKYLKFAQDLSSLRSDGGASLRSASFVNAVVAGYETNAFETSLSTTPADAQASTTAQFDNFATGAPSAAYYRANIGSVHGVDDLLGNDQLLGVTLTAFDIGDLSADKASVRRLLTEDPNASGSLASTDPRYMQFATEFHSLGSDQGAKIRSGADVDAVAAAFMQRQYQNAMPVGDAIDYYRANIDKVTDVNSLMNDGQLLYTTLTAFGIGSLLNDPATVRQLLTQDPAQAGSLAQSDPHYMAFATEFQSLKSDHGVHIQLYPEIDNVLSKYQAQVFQSAPSTDAAVTYYRNNIGTVKTADDLMNDGQLLNVALSAFGLGSMINDTAKVKQLLDEIPQLPTSLAQTDSRYMAFATTFANMWIDDGAEVHSAASINAVTSAFQNKAAQAPMTVAQSSAYYQDHIGSVANAFQLVTDKQLMGVALSAYGLGSLAGNTLAVFQLLTQDPNGAGALAQTDSRYLAFAQHFQAKNADGTPAFRNADDVAGVLSSYRSSESARIFALKYPSGQNSPYASADQQTIAGLLAKLNAPGSYSTSASYFKSTIGSTVGVDAFLADPKLVAVGLSAFHIDELAGAPATIRTLLTQDPNAQGALAQTDPRYMGFAKAFAPLAKGQRVGADTINGVLSAFQANEFQKMLDPNAQRALSNGSNALSVYQILADRTLTAVTRTALSLPDSVAALDVDQQISALNRAGFDVNKLQDPTYLNTFIKRFLVNTGMSQASQAPSLAVLFQTDDGSGSSGDATSMLLGGGSLNILA